MKRYVTMKCSVCTRSRDILINLKQYTTDKCTITLGCEGRLAPSGYTDDGSLLIGVPPTGVTNWYPRSFVPTGTATLAEDVLYDTSTGAKRQFVVAVSDTMLGFTPSNTATLTLNLIAEQQVARDYRQYTYRRDGSVTVINGVEDALAKKVLRYTITGPTPDLVEVYVNGVKQDMGVGPTQYQLYDGTISSPVPPNSVLFNTAVTGTGTQIDVIVTKAATLSTLAIPLVRSIDDDSRVGTGAWEGVDAVKNPATGQRYTLFYCDFTEIGTTPTDVKLRLNPSTPSVLTDGSTYVVAAAMMSILLSRTEVYTELDRQRAMHVPMSGLITNTEYMVIKFSDGVRQLLVTESAAVNVFPPYEVLTYNVPTRRRTGLAGNVDSKQLDNTFIIGPDV